MKSGFSFQSVPDIEFLFKDENTQKVSKYYLQSRQYLYYEDEWKCNFGRDGEENECDVTLGLGFLDLYSPLLSWKDPNLKYLQFFDEFIEK